MPPSFPGHIPDLVRDSWIETEFEHDFFRHFICEEGRSPRERFIRREERWVREKELGRGAYGIVYLERCAADGPPKLRAVKELKKFVVRGQELDYMMELEAIAKFSHKIYSHCFVRSNGWFELGDSVFITMEYLALGDLQTHLVRPFPEREARLISSQVLEGLGFMHDNGFVHRDLKPGNIMVVEAGPDWFVKIGDFGISKRRRGDGMSLQTNLQRGTLGYAAPEALTFKEDTAVTSYTSAVDMWSLGAVAYNILTNNLAFPNIRDMFLYTEGYRPFPSKPLVDHLVSDEGKAFIERLMVPSPRDRLSARSALKDPWMGLPFGATARGAEQR
ncbi:Serine/threonine-protein kinase ATG1 (Fragment) [Madurella fahalii]|uniref:Serine/threonine-protein kinase ATG1 n=1 Tax=Madurella fahalii TaxID=1157608 RepID=A0ABQ0GH80_9PEZI